MGRKQPKLVLRESCVADVSRTWVPGAFLEMGAGMGHMTGLFLERGFHGACYDLGKDSRQMLRQNLSGFGDRMAIVDDVASLTRASFDYLLAFEVLEHIQDDIGAMSNWVSYLKPGGQVLISVPAHARKYGRSDELVGHVRRYEKQQLASLLKGAGFEHIRIVNYGFPVTELTRRVSNWLVRKDRSYDRMTATERSIRSAQAKPHAINRVLAVFSGKLVTPFCVVQRWFYRRDWGDGFVATATKGLR